MVYLVRIATTLGECFKSTTVTRRLVPQPVDVGFTLLHEIEIAPNEGRDVGGIGGEEQGFQSVSLLANAPVGD